MNLIKICAGAVVTSMLSVGIAMAQETSTTQPTSLMRFELPAWEVGKTGQLTLASAGKVSVVDSESKPIWSVDAAAGPLTIEVSTPGYYTLSVTAADRTQESTFAVVPPLRQTPVDHPQLHGVNTHFNQRDMPDDAYPMLKLMHVDAVRDEMGWTAVEVERGVYQFSDRHVKYNRLLKENDIKLLFCAGYNAAKLYGAGRFPNVPEGVEPYGAYCVEVLKRFGDNIVAIEILNEPNHIDPVERYLPVLKSAYQQIRAAGLKTPVVAIGGAGAGGGMSPSYTTAVFNAGGADYCDSFSVHPYMTPFAPDMGYGENANADMAARRNIDVMKKYNKEGIWITEVGWPGPRPADEIAGEAATRPLGTRAMVPDLKQAAFTVRMMLAISRYPDVKGLFIYDFQDDGHIFTRREHRFGLVRQDLTPKPGYLAYSVTSNFLKGKTFDRRVHRPDGLLSANFYEDRDGNTWAAVWAQEATHAEVLAHGRKTKLLPERYMDAVTERQFRFTKAVGVVESFDWQGRPMQLDAEMTATNLPMYINLGKNASDVSIEAIGEK